MAKKSSWIVTLALALVLGLAALAPTSALAQVGSGTGTLAATGDGYALFRGDGTVTMGGSGVLWVRDFAGDASIEVSGRGTRREFVNGWVRYCGFDGNATIAGSNVAVSLTGLKIELEATGAGIYRLRGEGSYTVGAEQGTWPSQGIVGVGQE